MNCIWEHKHPRPSLRWECTMITACIFTSELHVAFHSFDYWTYNYCKLHAQPAVHTCTHPPGHNRSACVKTLCVSCWVIVSFCPSQSFDCWVFGCIQLKAQSTENNLPAVLIIWSFLSTNIYFSPILPSPMWNCAQFQLTVNWSYSEGNWNCISVITHDPGKMLF